MLVIIDYLRITLELNLKYFNSLQGTYVMEGTGKFLITAVGIKSQIGIIFSMMGSSGSKSKIFNFWAFFCCLRNLKKIVKNILRYYK